MFRYHLAAGYFCCLLIRAPGQEGAAAPKSTIFYAQDDQALEQFEENPGRTGPMVDRLVLELTGQPDLAKAWQSLVTPADRVGIKVSTVGGRYFSSHQGIVNAIVAGLGLAGIPPRQIVVWDRHSDDLREAGFATKPGSYRVRAVDPPRGFDQNAVFSAPALGKLMWGDLLFKDAASRPLGKAPDEAEQLSSNSHLAVILARDLTKIINVPVLSDERGCGVAGAIYNLTVPNIDNWRRFTQAEGPVSESLAELYADERIGPKVVLTVMDALLAQYAGGPAFSPNYAFAHQTIYASKDPVALDALALRKIDEWRKVSKLPPIAARGEWLKSAEALGLGRASEGGVLLQLVEPGR